MDEAEMELLNSLKKEDILEVLSDGFCHHSEALVHARIRSLHKRKLDENSYSNEEFESFGDAADVHVNGNNTSNSESLTRSLGKQWDSPGKNDSTLSARVNKQVLDSSPKYLGESDSELLLNDGISGVSSFENGLSEEQKEHIRYSQVHCKKDFTFIERVNGRHINLLRGLELHTGVFNVTEQKKIVEYIYRLQWRGKQGKLKDRTYSEPRKWMRGKGRATIQCGCCYNYAVDKNGNPPGIVRDEEVDPLPPVFRQMIKRMIRWNIVPSTCVPDSCIVNIYDVGDCIPPHIDHHDFVRPFYTVSFLNECKILFGSNLKVICPGEFSGPASISLPVGSVFVFNGNGADVAKHCIPSVSLKRISITFRKMDDRKLPYKFLPDPELEGIKPLIISPLNKPVGNLETQQQKAQSVESESNTVWKARKELFGVEDEFPPTNGSFRKTKGRQVHTVGYIEVVPAIRLTCTLEFDGASRGNPGPAGAGAILRAEDGSKVYRLCEGVGFTTNNVAEYRALILGLKQANRKGYMHIRVQGDSQLVCNQIQGLWNITSQNLFHLYNEAMELKDKFQSFSINHVPRQYNTEADYQANLAVNLQDGQVEEDRELLY